jgi:hypothetical protein
MENVAHEDDEPVWGAENIAKVIGRTTRQTFGLLEAGALPAKKIGNRWVGGRRKLRERVLGEDADVQSA